MTESVWLAEAPANEGKALAADATTDVCVIGAGIAGLSVAYEVARAGRRVLVLDAGAVGGGMTSRTTAHLANALDDRFYELERIHGGHGAKLAADSHTAAIERAAAIVAQESIDCEFVRLDGYLFLPPGESPEILEREREAARRAGLEVERLPRAPIGGFDTGACLRFPGQAQFHPLRYLAGLVRAIEHAGGIVYTGTRVTKVEGGLPAHVETESGHAVEADSVVVATNTPFHERFAIHTKQAPYTTYAIALEIERGDIGTVLLWDTSQQAGAPEAPYHYLRTMHGRGEGDLLIVGGEDHKTGQGNDPALRLARLEQWTRTRFPSVGAVRHMWSGQVLEPVDDLAFIGRDPAGAENVYIVTGDSGQGITHGIIAGMLIKDLALGRENPWSDLYDPSRVTLRTASELAKENLNVVAQLRDYVTPGEGDPAHDLPPGSGAVIRRGLSKIAAYRDEAGVLHEHSAICPHMKCVVRWNELERTWDCPCHGSQFDAEGRVIHGPAVSDLVPIR